MNQQKLIKVLIFIISAMMVFISAGCAQYINDEEQEKILKTADPITDRLLEAIETRDFSIIQSDFSTKLSADLTEEKFLTFVDTFNTALGKYQSRDIYHVKQDPEHVTIVYKMVFEKSDKVVLNLVFANDDLSHITGIRFTGPGLQ